MKSFVLLFATTVFATVSFAQIPITTVNTPPGSGPVAPQPQIVPCVPSLNTLANTTWAFNTSGGSVAQIGNFTIQPGVGGKLPVTGTVTTQSLGTTIERLARFTGSIDALCLARTNILAAGTLQIAEGLSGQILTWSYPITATVGADRSITYTVTSTTTMNLRRYGALDPPSTTNGYAYNDTYATGGVANQITGQLACTVPENAVLDILSPFGFSVALNSSTGGLGSSAGTQLIFKAGVGQVGTVSGNLFANDGVRSPQPTETGRYQVYPGCTGFSMNIPYLKGGRIVGANFEGVFAAGNFSRAFILATNVDGLSFTLVRLAATPNFFPDFPPR